ncbi:MAG: hypothetical protein HY211_02420 [Candidatus Omnitrophica bacterium]|nr:hypothetical protein [Candidatus Omnitrophota bacterium]
MKNLTETHSKMVERAKAQSGVDGLMKLYERFQKANAVTERYLQIISPKNRQSNSDTSLPTVGPLPVSVPAVSN